MYANRNSFQKGEPGMTRQYAAIDLKSFYASVECVERGLDPMKTNLVVADPSRSDQTICLAVSPPLKAIGVPGRPRLFEARRKVREINGERLMKLPDHRFSGSSFQWDVLSSHPEKALDFLIATPRMQTYINYSRRIYEIYLKYLAPEDIHVYSVDEIFADLTPYLASNGAGACEMTARMVRDIWEETGIHAAAGIGTNLYLAKIAMDILAKHAGAGPYGVRMACLDEMSYRRNLWNHRPITDFWRIGRGSARRLAAQHLYTMGDIARCSLGKESDYYNPSLLYRLFGMNAELLIDHAWGMESCTMADIHAYRAGSRSVHTGQVLPRPYRMEEAGLIVSEMAEELAMELTRRGLLAGRLTLTVGYDVENLRDPDRARLYEGAVRTDGYGRPVPERGKKSEAFPEETASLSLIRRLAERLFQETADPGLLVRRILLSAERVTAKERKTYMAESLFVNEGDPQQAEEETCRRLREERLQQTVMTIKNHFGKNAILKGMDLEQGALSRERNRQIGGHHE